MESSRPEISIITVVKDDNPGLIRTLKSLEQVSSARIEVIVIDGTYSSDILSVVKDYRSKLNIEANFLEPSGIYNAMNAGARRAKGEWLWFLNAGDYCVASKGKFEEILDLLARVEPETAGVVSPVVITTHNRYIYDVAIPEIFNGELHCNHQGVFVKREIYEKIGGFDETLKMAADGKFLDSLLKFGNIKEITTVITAFVMGGRSAKYFKMTLEEIATYRINGPSNKTNLLLMFKTKLRNKMLTEKNLNYGLVQKYLKLRENRVEKTFNKKVELPSRNDLMR
jgi:glycosyltransferase involved in cell wall biosynthesis